MSAIGAISTVNPKAEVVRAAQFLAVNISAAKCKRYPGCACAKNKFLTKGHHEDARVSRGPATSSSPSMVMALEMQIQHPTALLSLSRMMCLVMVAQHLPCSSLENFSSWLCCTYVRTCHLEGFEAGKKKALPILEKLKINVLVKIAWISLTKRVIPRFISLLTTMWTQCASNNCISIYHIALLPPPTCTPPASAHPEPRTPDRPDHLRTHFKSERPSPVTSSNLLDVRVPPAPAPPKYAPRLKLPNRQCSADSLKRPAEFLSA